MLKMRPLVICVALTMSAWPAAGADVQDAQYGYSFSMPTFPAAATGTATLRVTVAAPPLNGFAPNVGVMVQEVKTTREDYVVLSQKQFTAAGMKVLASTPREVSGHPGVVIEYEGQMQERRLHWLSLAVILAERVILVTCTADAGRFAELEPEFRRVVDSFRLDK